MDGFENILARRWFLVRAAAAAGLAIADETLNLPHANAQAAEPASGRVQSFTAAAIRDDFAALQSAPGNNKIVNLPTCTVALTVERKKAQKEFEWHESRDHIFQIVDGQTVIEVDGKPKGAHSDAPGEWNAPESEDAVKITLSKGDMLVIPRGVPHRRTTAGSVTLVLISPQGTV